MARQLTPIDGNLLMRALVRESTGQDSFGEINATNYISAGETVLRTGFENVFNALGMVMGRPIVASRPLSQKLLNIQSTGTDGYTNRIRKISFYSDEALPSGYFNTDLYTNLKDGFTAGENKTTEGAAQSTKSQWEQHPAHPLEMQFGGSTTWQYCITMYEEQVRAAFRNAEELGQFVGGMLQEHGNNIIRSKEAFNRLTLLNRIVMSYYYHANVGADTAINLTAAYNNFFGTSYTSAQLRSQYLTEFLQFMTATIKETVDRFTESSVRYHLPMTKTFDDGVSRSILRHTPRADQRLYLYSPLFRMAEAMVYSTIFNPQYLDMSGYEAVGYWQSSEDNHRASINFTGAYYDSVTGEQRSTGAIEIPYVVGVLMDRDAAMTDYQLERTLTTPVEARKGFRNTWLTIARNAITDPTENCVVFYMADEE